MGLKEWKMVYYPVPAYKVAKEDSLAACTLKWEGLREEIREQYSIYPISQAFDMPYLHIGDVHEEFLQVDGDSCALCAYYYGDWKHKECEDCPIVKSHGKTCKAEWLHFIRCGDAGPMIELLKATKESL